MRTALQIQQSVIFAFFIREMRTRFGEGRLGYFWMLLSPLLQITLLTLIFSTLSRHAMPGIDLPLFLITGMFPFFFFRDISDRAATAVDANRTLLAYRYVQPLDDIWARVLLELLLFLSSFAGFLLGCAWLGYHVLPWNPLQVMLAYTLLFIFSIGFGLVVGVASGLYPVVSKVLPLVNRPLIFISGVYAPLVVVPPQYREWLLWNPILNALELARENYFPTFRSGGASWWYLLLSSGLMLLVGLAVYKISRTKLIEND
jgi:capsular polysaccharide transport system permease protein